jgi:hypothetical protein
LPRKASAASLLNIATHPFNKLVKGTDCQADADNEKIKPTCISYDMISDDNFSGNDCGYKTLCKMNGFIEIIAIKIKYVLKPIKQRNFRVSGL